MANKHTIFLVHGMGGNGNGWHSRHEKTLRERYEAYPQLNWIAFDQRFSVVPISYNDEFEQLRAMWRESQQALGSALAATGIAVDIISILNDLAKSTDRNNFINTHVVDVLLYRYAAITASTIRESIRSQIFEYLSTKQDLTQPLNWSILAHSLGTAICHDALHEAYSDVPTEYGEKLAGITRPTVLAMIANVSRVLENDIDVYESQTRPGSPDDPAAACKYYLNARHLWDPFPQPKSFRPASHWPSLEARARGVYVPVEISDIDRANVHDLDHYLRNPLVHCAIFNCLLDKEILDEETVSVAHGKFAADMPMDDYGKLVKALKPVQLGEEDKLRKTVVSWARMLKL